MPLVLPIVSDRYGRLYSREKIIEELLDRKKEEKETHVIPHIRGLSDVVTVDILWDADEIQCPITKDTSGRFAYLRTCGCVTLYKMLKELHKHSSVCPRCDKKYDWDVDLVIINPFDDPDSKAANDETYARCVKLGVSHSKKRRKVKGLTQQKRKDPEPIKTL